MEKYLTAIREYLKLPVRQQIVVLLIVVIVGMGFLAKYLWDEVLIRGNRIDTLQAEVRTVNQREILANHLCDQKLFAQLLRSDSIKEKEKQDLIKLFDNHAEKVERLLTKKK